jgi:hypothetical protein
MPRPRERFHAFTLRDGLILESLADENPLIPLDLR